MAEYVYVGRQRHPVKSIVFQILTLGIYGRVYVYKAMREIDGHEALFLNRRPYILLLVLPIIGPFFVKRRLAILVRQYTHHEVTSQPVRVGIALALSVIPFAPFYLLHIQKRLNHHWKMHAKEEELVLKRAQLVSLQRRSRTAENQAAAKELEQEIATRAKELDDLRQAAIALREAELVRRQAEKEMRRAGLKRSRMGTVRKLMPTAAFKRPRPSKQSMSEAADEAEPPEELRKGRGRPEPELEPEPEPEPAPEPARRGKRRGEDELIAEQGSEAKPKRTLFGFLKREPADRGGQEDAKDAKVSRDERKALKRQLKEEKKAAKLEAKERKAAAKAKVKDAKAAAKAQAKDETQAAKRAAQKEKEKAKEAGKKATSKSAGRPAKGAKSKKPG